MDRRLLLMTLAAAGASGSAFAQGASAPAMSSAGGSSSMGQAEMDHATKTAMVGMASLKIANEGLEKATHARVKEFAKFEHDEQTTISEILMSMDPNMKAPAPDAKTAETIEKLGKMKAGNEFDRMFVQAQIEGHEKLLAIQEDYLKSGKDRETVNATKLMRGQIKEHLALLSDLHKMAG